MSPTEFRVDPYGRHRFAVDLDSVAIGGFNEIRGLSLTVGEQDDDPGTPTWQRLIERDTVWGTGSTADSSRGSSSATASSTLKLRRGVTDSRELWNWVQDWEEGAGEPRSLRVFLLDSEGQRVRGWECAGTRPVRWSGPTLTADVSGVAMETYEIAYEEIRLIDL